MILLRSAPTFKPILSRNIFHTYTNQKFPCPKICSNSQISNSVKYNQTSFTRNLFNNHKFYSKQSILSESTIKNADNNKKNNNINNTVPMALVQLDENNQQYLVIPINEDLRTGTMKNIQEFPKNILKDIEKINNELGKINFQGLLSSAYDLKNQDIPIRDKSIFSSLKQEEPKQEEPKQVSKTPIKESKKKSDKNLDDNIEDIRIFENADDIFSLDISHNGQNIMNKTPFTGVKLKFDMDALESEKYLKNIKSTKSNMSLPFNATIKGFVDLHRNKIINLQSFKEMNKNKDELSISAYICKVKKKKDKCAKEPKCRYAGMAGKLQPCEIYRRAVEQANFLRENYDPPKRRTKIILDRDRFKKEKPCKFPRQDS